MNRLARPLVLSGALLATPAHAFFDEIVLGLTSVSNNLIDSGENVANNTIATSSTTVLVLSRDIGQMADRIDRMADKIGLMADRIGVMADRIVFTESMLANFAHKLVDRGAAVNPYSVAQPVALAAPVSPVAPAATLVCALPAHPEAAQAC
jgi:hypothetical protein